MLERVLVIVISTLWIVMALGIIGWLGYVFVIWLVTGILNLLFLV